MKKRIKLRYPAVALSLLLLGGTIGVMAATQSPGSSGDPFVSLSYITDTYIPGVLQELSSRASEQTAPILSQAQAALGIGEGVSDFSQGETVTLYTGGYILLISGSATADFISGALLDVTEGTEVKAGSALTLYHRYVAAEASEVTIGMTAAAQAVTAVGDSNDSGLPFNDVKSSDWYYSYIQYVYEQGLFNGVTETVFSPNGEMNRAMLATVLYRLGGEAEAGFTNPFSDVTAGEWYTDGVVWAAHYGIVQGVGDTSFSPEASVTREQIAVMLYRYAMEYLEASDSASGDLAAFSDAANISSWAVQGISWAVDNGILNGMGDGALYPNSTATRAEVATMLQRFSTMIAT